jgi:hypothetical protein
MPKQELIDEINSKDIPEDVRAKALAAVEKLKGYQLFHGWDEVMVVDDIRWDSTPEGHEFWEIIDGADVLYPVACTARQSDPEQTTRKQRILDRLTSVEQQQEEAESMRWQKRDEELAAITVDRSRPFIGAADVQWMLKGRRSQ